MKYPLRTDSKCGFPNDIMDGTGIMIAHTVTTEGPEDARRIVACMNACNGIPTLLLESKSITGENHPWQLMLLQRNELHAIVRECLAAIGNGSGATEECSVEFLRGAPEEIRKEIASLKGRP